MAKNFNLALICLLGVVLVACNGGGGSSGGDGGGASTFVDNPIPPSPIQPVGSYNGQPYTSLGQPTGLTGAYPSTFWPNGLPSLQIAYGNNSESDIADLAAYVTMGNHLCSATPVKYDPATNTTFLVGAAHCFVNNKTSPTTLSSGNLISSSVMTVYHGVNAESSLWESFPVVAVYLRQDYCYNATFSAGGDCPNFSPNEGALNGQGNDIAVIQISGRYANPTVYPQLAQASQYPKTYTAAPVLSIGYGINTQTPNGGAICNGACGTMFYTANYQYWQQDATGYHYLYNSFYNNGGFGQSGYSALICGGDSGGGDLFWTGINWILLSEHTYGPSNSCGTFYNYLPNGATNISAYYDWIQSILTNVTPVVSCSNGSISNCVTNG